MSAIASNPTNEQADRSNKSGRLFSSIVGARHIYWTNRGNSKQNDGSILRSDLDGKNMITIICPGGTFTPEHRWLEKKSRKLYCSDREGMRVMQANLEGSKIGTLVDQARAIRARWPTRGDGVRASR